MKFKITNIYGQSYEITCEGYEHVPGSGVIFYEHEPELKSSIITSVKQNATRVMMFLPYHAFASMVRSD